jgi:protein-arginine kinase activator protein McsA
MEKNNRQCKNKDKDEDKALRDKLIALFSMFENKPHLMAEYFLEYDLLKSSQKEQLLTNESLEEKTKEFKETGKIIKPYFKNLEQMQKYYNDFFYQEEIQQKHPILGYKTRKESLLNQLENAIQNEEFEKAAKLRDYIKELGI